MSALCSAPKIAERLAERIDSLIPELLSSARRSGGYWQAGNVEGDAGGSLYIHRSGLKTGKWTDAATGQFGDLLDLVNAALFGNQDMRQAMRWASEWLGDGRPAVPPGEARPNPSRCNDDEAKIAVARNLWTTCQPIAGTLGETYLRFRAITIEMPPTLRFAPALMHYAAGAPLPAVVAAISGPAQKPTAVQRIYLRPDGCGKASVADPKKTLGKKLDGACRLAPAGRELGLAEGIETGLSAMELYGIPVWAACGSRMDAIAISDDVKRLVIFADNGSAGTLAAERAARAHKREGRAIAIVYPPQPHKDWNDLLRADAARTVAA